MLTSKLYAIKKIMTKLLKVIVYVMQNYVFYKEYSPKVILLKDNVNVQLLFILKLSHIQI